VNVRPKVGGWLLTPTVSSGFGQIVAALDIPDGWMGLNIGPNSIKTFNEALNTTKTVIWNGPMGVFEFEKFVVGTEVIIVALP
jgi:3-phosphoglycerate kinase